MMSATDEDLELELRSLPGVLNVEIRHLESGEVDVVTLIVNGHDPAAIRVMAKQIVSLYSAEGSVVVEDATTAFRPRAAEAIRVSLVGTSFDHETGRCEVELNNGGRIGIGHSASGKLVGGAEATLAALRDLNLNVPFYLISVLNVATPRGWPVVVTLRPFARDNDLLGIAQGDNDVSSSAMATLSALNRILPISNSVE
ncbi:MAG TPA: hypothetical protein VGE75_03195 [Acidimicrobiales bacterium]